MSVLPIFGPLLAVFCHFGTENFSKCEQSAHGDLSKDFRYKKLFGGAPNNDFASFFFFAYCSPSNCWIPVGLRSGRRGNGCMLFLKSTGVGFEWFGVRHAFGGEFWRIFDIFGPF